MRAADLRWDEGPPVRATVAALGSVDAGDAFLGERVPGKEKGGPQSRPL